jgi:hypothetical protein
LRKNNLHDLLIKFKRIEWRVQDTGSFINDKCKNICIKKILI